MLIIDGHTDAILDVHHGRRDFFERSDSGHVDLPRLQEAGISAVALALFTTDEHVADATSHTRALLSTFDRLVMAGRGLVHARSASDIERSVAEGTTAGFVTIEGGEAIGTSIETLHEFHERGVILMTLTWNRRNAIARGVYGDGDDGLSAFGREVVREMEAIGMIVDVSHLSDQALTDVLSVATRPIVASHSNARALCNHPRNLTDDQLRAIASLGGLVGVTFPGVFVDPTPANVTMDRVFDHLTRMIDVAGIDHIGIGTDFDGFTAPYGLVMPDCTGLPMVAGRMATRGYSQDEIEKVMGRNWLRVIRDVVGK
ncbi:MAG: membrane dipeptidase [Spirochaetaceae bacterium]|nr:MAG: membrane dipeptidase [Spirochaetaceae bacterium]